MSASQLHEIPVLHTAFVQIGEELHYLNHPIRPENVHQLPVYDSIKGVCEGNCPKEANKNHATKTFNVLKLSGKGKLPMEMDPPMMDFGQKWIIFNYTQKIELHNETLKKCNFWNVSLWNSTFWGHFKYDNKNFD